MIAAMLTAAWLGLLTAVSPCPLATNVAAVGFLGRHAANPRKALLSGLSYVLGRTICYTAIAAGLAFGILAAVQTSATLSRMVGLLVGPLLIIAGAVMFGWIKLPSFGLSAGISERLGRRSDLTGAALLGALFALSFCPASAAIFFGGLVPLTASSESVLVLPVIYGVATGLPVLAFAVLLAAGGHGIGRVFAAVQRIESWFRRATAILLVAIGLYLIARTNLRLW
jgi:cytochrome c-type biogenesis protein